MLLHGTSDSGASFLIIKRSCLALSLAVLGREPIICVQELAVVRGGFRCRSRLNTIVDKTLLPFKGHIVLVSLVYDQQLGTSQDVSTIMFILREMIVASRQRRPY